MLGLAGVDARREGSPAGPHARDRSGRYARAGEVKALTFDDIDLERGIVHIHESVNRLTGQTKTTKTGVTRRIPLEPELWPLFKAMRDEHDREMAKLGPEQQERDGKRRLFAWAARDRKLSRQVQHHLKIAGVTRADLFADDASRKPMTFHDLRATGITWCAVRGDDPLKIKQRAGHATFSTTEGYIREAENLGGNFGEVFPPLPPDLTTPPRIGPQLGNWAGNRQIQRENGGAAGNRSFLYGAQAKYRKDR